MDDHTRRAAPPTATRIVRRIEQFGRVREDEYAWMRDENWQRVLRDPSVLRADISDHLRAENAYTDAVLAGTKDLQSRLVAELRGRIKEDDSSVPAPDGPYLYYRRFAEGAEHPVFARRAREAEDAPEEILLDADEAARGHAYFRIGAARHSPDHRLFAWAEDTQGSEVFRIRIKNLETGEMLPATVESTTGDFDFAPDSRFLFWTFRDDHGRPRKIFRREIGTDRDVEIYEETDEGFFLHVETTLSGRSILIVSGNQETSEARRIPGDDPTAAPRIIAPRETGIRYDVDDWGDRLVIRTNLDGAIDFRLVEAPLDSSDRATWRELLPHRPGHFVTGFVCLENHLIRTERVEANTRIVIRTRDGAESEIAVDEPAYALRIEPGYEYRTSTIRYVRASPSTPRRWIDRDLDTGAETIRKTQEIPSGHDPSRYEVRRITARAADGATIPVTILMRRGTPLDGSAPLHLYGYGSYGIAMEPGFSTGVLSLVDRGMIHAIAHIRGGSEKGWGWFLDGRGAQKMNSFTDFIAAAEALIDAGYTKAGRIVAHGGSAGGLLVGAALNLRPDLWAGVIAAVPFVDVLNTMSDASLPLTPPEWPEWGNPLEDEAAYDTIAAYSPYDNIGAKPYPPVLATGGLSDPRVTYWEPAKFIARLRDRSTGDAPALLHMQMEAGHGGAAGRFDSLKEIALDYAFALWCVGLAETA